MTEPPASDETLARDMESLQDARCIACSTALCGHLAVINIVLGFKDAPRCIGCLAAGMDQTAETLRDNAWAHVSRRDCFRRAWQDSNRRESFERDALPRCLWPRGAATPPAESEPNATSQLSAEAPDAIWDAGNLSCGDLVLALRGKIRSLPPYAVLRVIALDPAAREDLPAWCRLTRNQLLRSTHPEYDIRRPGE